MCPIPAFCVFVVLFINLLGTCGQSCVPGPVRNLSVTLSRGLSWVEPVEHCNATNYLVTVRKDGNPNLVFYVETPRLNLTSLPICENYEFSIIAVTPDHVQGLETIIYAKTPAQGFDLTVAYLSATQNGSDILLEWSMKTGTGVERCVDVFRVVVWDEDTVIPTDIYVQDTTFTLPSVTPCMIYEFEIRAIVGIEDEGDPIYGNYTASGVPPAPPTLSSIDRGVTNVIITWNLQSYSLNRCPITALIADSSPNFNVTFPVVDSSTRPPYTMALSGLEPSTTYLCRIYIVNSVGISTPLAMAIQTEAVIRTSALHERFHKQLQPQLLQEPYQI